VSFDDPSRKARDAIGAAVAVALVRDLRCFGWEAACFSTPLDAVSFLERPESRIRVALVDHAGPSNGRELLAFLADEKPLIRRVLLAEGGRPSPDELGGLARRRRPAEALGSRRARAHDGAHA
jgi:hypothetical protein